MTRDLLSQVGLTCLQKRVSQTQRATHVLLGLRAARLRAHQNKACWQEIVNINDIARKHAKLRNDDRDYTELTRLATHYGCADQKLNQEWHATYGQPRLSGDDMKTLQVGTLLFRSRYHRNRRFYRTGNGVNHLIHDFPSAELGLELGGLMVLLDGVGQNARRASFP